jgi:N utilization substance protein B
MSSSNESNASLSAVFKRRHARRLAMTIVYSTECTGYKIDIVMALTRELRPDWNELPDFTVKLCHVMQEHDLEIEKEVTEILENWRLSRIAPVERALLKIGCAEILYFHEIPPRVTINEYIELAKMFANENAPAFINGILDKLVHKIDKPDVQRIHPA